MYGKSRIDSVLLVEKKAPVFIWWEVIKCGEFLSIQTNCWHGKQKFPADLSKCKVAFVFLFNAE